MLNLTTIESRVDASMAAADAVGRARATLQAAVDQPPTSLGSDLANKLLHRGARRDMVTQQHIDAALGHLAEARRIVAAQPFSGIADVSNGVSNIGSAERGLDLWVRQNTSRSSVTESLARELHPNYWNRRPIGSLTDFLNRAETSLRYGPWTASGRNAQQTPEQVVGSLEVARRVLASAPRDDLKGRDLAAIDRMLDPLARHSTNHTRYSLSAAHMEAAENQRMTDYLRSKGEPDRTWGDVDMYHTVVASHQREIDELLTDIHGQFATDTSTQYQTSARALLDPTVLGTNDDRDRSTVFATARQNLDLALDELHRHLAEHSVRSDTVELASTKQHPLEQDHIFRALFAEPAYAASPALASAVEAASRSIADARGFAEAAAPGSTAAWTHPRNENVGAATLRRVLLRLRPQLETTESFVNGFEQEQAAIDAEIRDLVTSQTPSML